MEGAQRLFLPMPTNTKDRPTYAEVAEGRHVLNRFSRFLKLVDKLLEDLLCRLVKTAVQIVIEFLYASYKHNLVDEERSKEFR